MSELLIITRTLNKNQSSLLSGQNEPDRCDQFNGSFATSQLDSNGDSHRLWQKIGWGAEDKSKAGLSMAT